jgi:drug/metabolite transporter (DMT)-like permease
MARLPDVAILTLLVLVRRPPLPGDRGSLAPLLVIGVFDLLANVMFTAAAGLGLLSVVGVLGSLYPAVTVVLARVLLHERPTAVQDAGVMVVLAGVLAIAAG